jgi:chaperonin GroES
MKLRPLADRVIVKPISDKEATVSGIILPDTVDKEKSEKGEIIAVGPGKTTDEGKIMPLAVKVGDKVLFKKYSPDEFELDGEEYLILSESDLMAVIE